MKKAGRWLVHHQDQSWSQSITNICLSKTASSPHHSSFICSNTSSDQIKNTRKINVYKESYIILFIYITTGNDVNLIKNTILSII